MPATKLGGGIVLDQLESSRSTLITMASQFGVNRVALRPIPSQRICTMAGVFLFRRLLLDYRLAQWKLGHSLVTLSAGEGAGFGNVSNRAMADQAVAVVDMN